MAYNKTTWVDGPAGGTPINATNLQNIEDGIEALESQSVGGWTFKAIGDDGTSVVSFDKLFIDTTGGSTTYNLVLPVAPTIGDTVKFVDVAGNFATEKLTINVDSGDYLMGVLDDFLELTANFDFVELTYAGDNTENSGAGDFGWVITGKP